MKYIYIIIFLFLSIQINAQITVNSGISPESFSTVQVEGSDKGVRLPRMTSTAMTNLKTSLTATPDERAIGLVVYNETDNKIQFWDGSDWSSLTSTFGVDNGLTLTGTTPKAMELGGTLTSNTEIDQKTFNLDFKHTASSTGDFSINNSTIKDGVVGFNTTDYKVNATDLIIGTTSTVMNASELTVNTKSGSVTTPEVFTINDTGTTINGTFNHSHSSLEEGYLLTSDASGNATWQGLRPFGTVKESSINNDVSFYTTLGEQVISNSDLLLEPGQWIIFAKCTAQANYSSTFMYHWLKLQSSTSSSFSSATQEVMSGINPELVTSGTAYSCPNLVHFVDITTPTYYRLTLSTSNNLSDKTISGYGGSHFYAVRIDVATP